MGLDIDFTKYKSKDDRMYLDGKRPGDGREYAISQPLEDDMRSFGRAMHHKLTGTNATDQEAFQSRNAIIEALQGGSAGGRLEAIDRLSSYTVPSSPSASKAASGGIQQKVGAVDQALTDLVEIIKMKTGELNGSQSGGR
jgi:hypothetical protein